MWIHIRRRITNNNHNCAQLQLVHRSPARLPTISYRRYWWYVRRPPGHPGSRTPPAYARHRRVTTPRLRGEFNASTSAATRRRRTAKSPPAPPPPPPWRASRSRRPRTPRPLRSDRRPPGPRLRYANRNSRSPNGWKLRYRRRAGGYSSRRFERRSRRPKCARRTRAVNTSAIQWRTLACRYCPIPLRPIRLIPRTQTHIQTTTSWKRISVSGGDRRVWRD